MTMPTRGEVLRLELPADRVEADLVRRGFQVGRIEAADRRSVLEGIGQALRFPTYYRPNLDALWDCLTDLDQPTALVWSGWEGLAVDHPDDWAAIMAVLRDRVRTAPPFTLALAGRSTMQHGMALG